MPAYIRLLAYFSNFILLATFLGGGLGCLLARRRWSLIAWFPLVPLLVVIVAMLFITVAQRMGRELTTRPPLVAYAINLVGSLAGVAGFALLSWLELPPAAWFAVAFAAALPFLFEGRRAIAVANAA